MPTTDALRDLRLGDPVVETGESGMCGERGTVVASASRPGELAVLWHASERLPAGLQTGITHGTLLDVDALRARVATLEDKRQHALADAEWFCNTARGYMDERDDLRREVEELRADRLRLRDLVRHQRGPLHDAGLLTDEEYASLAADSGAVARLETYDSLRKERDALRAQQ